MKKILTALLILISIGLMATTEKLNVLGREIKLEFDNVQIKKLKFYDGEQIVVQYPSNDVQIENNGESILFKSEFKTKLSLKLPEELSYTFEKDDNIAKFTKNNITIQGKDGEIVTFQDGNLTVEGSRNERVQITDDGIFVEDDDETVRINKDGIIVKNDEEDKELTGFWGKMLGSFIRSVANASINYASKRPEKIVKWMINDSGDYNEVNVSWNDNDDDYDYDYDEYSDEGIIEKNILKTFEMNSKDNLFLDNINGSIFVGVWDKSYAQCDITLKSKFGEDELDKIKINFIENNGLKIETEKLEKRAKVTVNYDIMIPQYVAIKEIGNLNGSVKIVDAEVLGNVVSSNGSIRLNDGKGNVNLDTSNGAIKIMGFEGQIKATTSNGKISAMSVTGDLELHTSNGAILTKDTPYLKSADTINGKITVFSKVLNNDLVLESSNGSIQFNVNPDLHLLIEASTTNGSISVNELPLEIVEQKSNYLKGKLNKGSHNVILATSNSSVKIKGVDFSQ